MMRVLLFLALLGLPAWAEDVASGTGAELRAIDKLTGELQDVTIAIGNVASIYKLDVQLSDCRYPSGDPASNAYAYLTIVDSGAGETAFRGWMIASSPALNALDHRRYDVWVLRCTTS